MLCQQPLLTSFLVLLPLIWKADHHKHENQVRCGACLLRSPVAINQEPCTTENLGSLPTATWLSEPRKRMKQPPGPRQVTSGVLGAAKNSTLGSNSLVSLEQLKDTYTCELAPWQAPPPAMQAGAG